MTHGIDTDFMVAVEIIDHPFHRPADVLLHKLLDGGHDFALVPQTLAEFIHIVTDGNRMPRPLEMDEAIRRAEHWWHASEVLRVFPDGGAVGNFTTWLARYRLGRKRLLDTMLAATFHSAAIKRIITNNERDFKTFKTFEVVTFRS